jgi:hypothetical protein
MGLALKSPTFNTAPTRTVIEPPTNFPTPIPGAGKELQSVISIVLLFLVFVSIAGPDGRVIENVASYCPVM